MADRRGRFRGAVGGVLLGLVLVLQPAGNAAAQRLDVSGYALTLGARAGASDLGPAGTTLLGRVRVMPIASSGGVTVDVAYEHVLSRTPEGGGLSLTPGGSQAAGGDWLGADWSLRSTSRTEWRHGFDRLSRGWEAGNRSVVAGRQAISWATTLFLPPADPFVPFDPSDPFREYRAGVDAIRLRYFPGPFSEVEGVLRAAETPDGTLYTALARGQTSLDAWALGGWAGALHGEAAGALFATGAVGATAVRAEASLRRDPEGGTAVRGALGLDRRLSAAGRDLYLVAEIQLDGFGANDPEELLKVARSGPFLRGEMQTLGAWSGAAQVSYQVHPLLSVDAMVLGSLTDGSALLAPGLSWSASAAAAVRLGAYVGMGPSGVDAPRGLASEYGAIPALGYAALSWFF